MKFRKILVATDFSPGSQRALAVATRIAKACGAEVVVVHAFEDPTAFGGELPAPADVVEEVREHAVRELGQAVRDAKERGVEKVSPSFLGGAPADVVTDLIESSDVDLLVIGTHGRTGLSRVLLGSVAEKLVRRAPCSVLVVRKDSNADAFAHVLCPIDGASSSDAVLQAAAVAELDGAKITLVNVAEVGLGYTGQRAVQYIAALGRYSEELLRKAADELRGTTSRVVATKSAIGSPGGQILGLLDEDRTIDLVVMGTHGRSGLKRVLLGSVAEKLVRHARCPVLVARART